MRTLHLAPGHSAAGSLRQTFRQAGLDQEVLTFPDDLSCGPIRALDAAARTAWWEQFGDYDISELEPLAAFWNRLATSDDRIIAWLGRRSAKEFTFLLAVAHELGDRRFSIIDVAEPHGPPLRLPESGFDFPGVVSMLPPALLHTLIGTERPVASIEHTAMSDYWRTLQQENAPFRIAAGADLVSVREDYFDAVLLAETTTEPQKAVRVVCNATGHERADMQVEELMLLSRLVALIEAGKVIADGDPWDMWACLVRLPG